ncbi:MAG: PD40 domain-containing protein [Armatimonadetes bacterium]|nr:PD40 domain-containing protein [Armatimonadota bacterium]
MWKDIFKPLSGGALYGAIFGVLALGMAVFFLLQLIPRNMRRRVIAGFTFVGGLYYLLGWLLPGKSSLFFFWVKDNQNIFSQLEEPVADVLMVIGAFTIGLGLINLTQIHGRSLLRRRSGWHNSLAFFIALIAMAIFTLIDQYRPALQAGTPSYAPDGRIAMAASSDAGSSLYLLSPDGLAAPLPKPPKGEDLQPAWSPDGSRIAFVSTRDGNSELYLMNPDGTGVQRLTNTPEEETGPSWSPDSRRIVYAFNNKNVSSLKVLDREGGVASVLWNAAAEVSSPAWSPNGRRIAFAMRDGAALAIFTVGANGSGLRRLSPAGGTGDDISPAWSLDGRRIAFVSNRGERATNEIWAMNADGGAAAPVTRRAYLDHEDSSPVWSRDGRRITYVSTQDEIPLIYTVRADGSGEARLSEYPLPWQINRILFFGLLSSLDATMFSLLAFYIAAAAYRAFRVRSVEASLMMAAAFIVLIGQVPLGMALTGGLPTEGWLASFRIEVMSNWVLQIINAPAYRAMGFGLALGGLAMALRIWLSLERGSYFDREL